MHERIKEGLREAEKRVGEGCHCSVCASGRRLGAPEATCLFHPSPCLFLSFSACHASTNHAMLLLCCRMPANVMSVPIKCRRYGCRPIEEMRHGSLGWDYHSCRHTRLEGKRKMAGIRTQKCVCNTIVQEAPCWW